MKKPDWLTLFGWPALAVIILFLLLAGPLFLTDKRTPPTGPFAAAADVKYTVRNGQKPIVSEETAEIRTLYASDLFASSRGNRLSAFQTATNRSDPRDIIPSENQLFLSFPPGSKETGGQWFAMTGRKIDNHEADPEFRFHSLEGSSHRAKKNPKLSVELKGELKHFSIESDIFKDITLPTGQKSWSVQAEVCFNAEGFVDYVFAESDNRDPALYHEIIRRLYQCRLTNVTQTCEGIILISYPTYSAANHFDSADLSKKQNAASK